MASCLTPRGVAPPPPLRLALPLLILAASLLGCAHRFATVELDDDLRIAKNAEGQNKSFDGIIVYQPALKKLTYKFTVATNSQGLVVATEGGNPPCHPQKKIELKTLPNYGARHGVIYKPGFFASGSITINLKDGILTSVNAVSDPQVDETITAIAGLVSSAATAAAAGAPAAGPPAPPGMLLCNAAPELLSITDP